MRERYRAELIGWMDSLHASHQELSYALARSAAVMAEREIAERRLREGEAMLRTVFDAAPDNIAITRMSDGATLEVEPRIPQNGFPPAKKSSRLDPQAGPLVPPAASRTGASPACTRQRAQFSRPSCATRMAGSCRAWFRRRWSSLGAEVLLNSAISRRSKSALLAPNSTIVAETRARPRPGHPCCATRSRNCARCRVHAGDAPVREAAGGTAAQLEGRDAEDFFAGETRFEEFAVHLERRAVGHPRNRDVVRRGVERPCAASLRPRADGARRSRARP